MLLCLWPDVVAAVAVFLVRIRVLEWATTTELPGNPGISGNFVPAIYVTLTACHWVRQGRSVSRGRRSIVEGQAAR